MQTDFIAEPAVSPPLAYFEPASAQRVSADAELMRFVHALAHELKTPVASIAGFAAALDRASAPDADAAMRHYLSRIRAAAAQLDEYLAALLSVSRAAENAVRLAQVDLSRAAEEILADLQLREPTRQVQVQVTPGMRAYGDPALLRMVLENLLGNAWKFTGGRRPARIAMSVARGSGWQSVYRVDDNGVGFDPQYAHKLFKDFQRLHSQHEFPGTGLGLANVQRIVTRHGGRVWAQSSGEGASFFFTLAAPIGN